MAFIDLDDFKAVNDRHGHEVGDQFLAEIGAALARGLRADDFIPRLGGDEIVAVASVAIDRPPQALDALHKRLLAATTGRFTLGQI